MNSIKFRVEGLDENVANEIWSQLDQIYDLLWRTLKDTYVMEHPEATDDEINLFVNQRIALESEKD